MVSVDSSFLDFLKCSVFSSFLQFSRAKWPWRARVCLAFLSCLGFLALSRAKWPRWARVSRFSRVLSVLSSFLEAGGLGGFESLDFLEFSRVFSSQVASVGSSFSVLGAWPRIWAKEAPERSFGAFWVAGARYGQK